MAKYQNGLHLFGTTTSNCGYIFCRWMFEWLTQVVGWTNVDTSDSKWTDVEASGTGGTAGATTAVAYEIDMSSSGRSWTAADIGKLITITGLTTATRDGVYKIAGIKAGDIVCIDIDRGVHVAGLPNSESFSWRLWDESTTYQPPSLSWAVVRGAYSHTPSEPNFDILITANDYRDTGSGGAPSFALGPFGTWNNVTHSWSDDRVATKTIGSSNPYGAAVCRIWAYADDNHALIHMFTSGSYDGTANQVALMYLGEITVPDTGVDTNPGVIANGWMTNYGGAILWKVIGPEWTLTSLESFGNRFKWLSHYGSPVDGNAQVPIVVSQSVSQGYNAVQEASRRISSWSRYIYRLNISLECTVIGSEENRGIIKDVWCGGRNLPYVMPFGSSKEFLHLVGGVSIPWNGSDVRVVT